MQKFSDNFEATIKEGWNIYQKKTIKGIEADFLILSEKLCNGQSSLVCIDLKF